MFPNFVSNLNQISVTFSGKSVDLSKVVSMIDETVTVLKAEWSEDDGKKACCIKSIDHTEDEAKVLAHQICDNRETIADHKDQLSNPDECTVEEIIDVPIPQLMDETIEAVKLIPHDKVQQRTVEKTR